MGEHNWIKEKNQPVVGVIVYYCENCGALKNDHKDFMDFICQHWPNYTTQSHSDWFEYRLEKDWPKCNEVIMKKILI